MGIQLNKQVAVEQGARFDFSETKEKGMSKIRIGLGWNPCKLPGVNFDLDASAILLRSDKLQSSADAVFFNNKRHSSGAVYTSGDNLTGAGSGDDETITVDLDKLPSDVNRVLIVVNIYKGVDNYQRFEVIPQSYIRAIDESGKELVNYVLEGDKFAGETAILFGEIYKHNDTWKFKATGTPLRPNGQLPNGPTAIFESYV